MSAWPKDLPVDRYGQQASSLRAGERVPPLHPARALTDWLGSLGAMHVFLAAFGLVIWWKVAPFLGWPIHLLALSTVLLVTCVAVCEHQDQLKRRG